jgi:hypothetical protein
MSLFLSCICGYRGPSVSDEGRDVCPICRSSSAARDDRLHIACPRGHVLEVSESMLGQRVVCPKCNQFFVLSADASLERKREMERLQHERDAKLARIWLSRAIWAAVVVVAALVGMVVMTTMQGG